MLRLSRVRQTLMVSSLATLGFWNSYKMSSHVRAPVLQAARAVLLGQLRTVVLERGLLHQLD